MQIRNSIFRNPLRTFKKPLGKWESITYRPVHHSTPAYGGKTKKVGITGRYGVRYGSNLRKKVKKYLVSSSSKHFCHFCGKVRIKRRQVSIWKCTHCGITMAGGAYTLHSPAGTTVRSVIRRIRDTKILNKK